MLDKKDLAKKEFSKLLFISPKYTLNHFKTPPPALLLFKSTKSKIEKTSANLLALKTHQNILQKNVFYSIKPSSLAVRLSAFMPFGYGQFFNKQTTKGKLFALVQATLLSINIGSFWWKKKYLIDNLSQSVKNETEQKKYQTAQTIQLASFGLFLISYAYSTVDAFLNQK